MDGELRENFSLETMGKAEALVSGGKVRRDDTYPQVWWVDGSKEYRVQLGDGDPMWVTCTCPNGQRRTHGAVKCYHAAAALLKKEELDG